jgi:DNA polymerase-1
MFGRKRKVPEIKSQNSNTRGLGERLAVNSPIQGSAADVIKIAMIHIRDSFLARRLRSRMILQVHDELVFELNEEELDETKNIVKEKMENVVGLSVPLKVEIGHGRNWAEAHG